AIAYLTAAALSGQALGCAWCVEAIALSRVTRGGDSPVARYGALAFIALAVGHVLVIEAPPSALVTGTADLGAAALGIGATALGTFCIARAFAPDDVMRVRLFAGSAAALLYIGSVAVVTMFQPGAETSP